jgi:hypothetical protein
MEVIWTLVGGLTAQARAPTNQFLVNSGEMLSWCIKIWCGE